MSDFHKHFLKKIKQKEQAYGLSLLSEDPCSQDSIGNDVNPNSEISLSNSEHDLVTYYDKIKLETFPVIETYKDIRTSIEFQTYYRPPSSSELPVFICHHGAGSSSMTFCKLASTLHEAQSERNATKKEYPGIFVFDMRGHGGSSTKIPFDYSLESLTKDFEFIIDRFHNTHQPTNSIYLVGHSLGGAVLTNYILLNPEAVYKVKGLVMIDIVEETAVKSLKSMPQFIRNRPLSFPTYQRAIDWHVHEIRLINNIESAKLSIPDLLKRGQEGLTWRTNLQCTEPFWDSWFKDLSKNFVNQGSNTIARLLVLSGHETLDTNLLIGQMQGKYQLIVFNNTAESGHFVQEDIPKHLAISLLDFTKRNDSPEEYMRKELGFTPKWGGKINK